jgi:hypothetical protein
MTGLDWIGLDWTNTEYHDYDPSVDKARLDRRWCTHGIEDKLPIDDSAIPERPARVDLPQRL